MELDYDRWTTPESRQTVIDERNRLLNWETTYKKHIEDLATEVRQAHHAIQFIGERLIREAEDRDWCDEFDRFVESVNNEIPSRFALPTRRREYEVTWSETVTVTVDRSVTVIADNPDDAIECAKEIDDGASNNEIMEAIRYGGWETIYDSESDYEVTEI